MSNHSHSEESDLQYLEITDEILDGILPQEEIGEAISVKRENNIREKFLIDIYGRPQLICDCKDESDYDSEEDSSFQREPMKENSTYFSTIPHAVTELLPYTNIHVSILFIIILSILTLVIPNISSVIATIIIVISLVRLDHKYKWGITLCED